jgi:hypothetical protein
MARFEDMLSHVIFHMQRLYVHSNQQLISRHQSVSQSKTFISNHISRSIQSYPQLMTD